jgi:hypothetical protein
MFEMINNGSDIVSTTYWDSEHANIGLCYLSGNAGAWRLLVPEAAEGLLTEMRTGTRATIEPSIRVPEAWDVVFEDGTEAPFSLTIDKRQVDRAVETGTWRLLVVTQRGVTLELPCSVRGA